MGHGQWVQLLRSLSFAQAGAGAGPLSFTNDALVARPQYGMGYVSTSEFSPLWELREIPVYVANLSPLEFGVPDSRIYVATSSLSPLGLGIPSHNQRRKGRCPFCSLHSQHSA